MKTIGTNRETFQIIMNEKFFNKGDIINPCPNTNLLITKIHTITWFDILLLRLGFKIKLFKGITVESLDNIEEEYIHFKFLQKYKLI